MNKEKIVVAITLLISIFSLTACKENIPQISGENQQQEANMENENLNNENSNEDEQQGFTRLVYDAEYEKNVESSSYETEFGEVYNVEDIEVPFINIKSDDANKANNEIRKVFDSAIATFNEGIHDKTTYVEQCDYKAYINENTLSVVLVYGVGGTDVVYPEYYVYNFDLDSGNTFSYEDAYTYASFDATVIDEKVKNAIRNKMIEMCGEVLTEVEIENYINSSVENYNNSLKDNTIKYFIDDEEKLNVIVNLQIPAGRGEIDTIIQIGKNEKKLIFNYDEIIEKRGQNYEAITKPENVLYNTRVLKIADKFVLKADIGNPYTYTAEEIIKIVDDLENSDDRVAKLGEYTIHKDYIEGFYRWWVEDFSLEYEFVDKSFDKTKWYDENRIPYYITDSHGSLVIFKNIDGNYYPYWRGIPVGDVALVDNIKEDAFELVLNDEDKIVLVHGNNITPDSHEEAYTVKELFEKKNEPIIGCSYYNEDSFKIKDGIIYVYINDGGGN